MIGLGLSLPAAAVRLPGVAIEVPPVEPVILPSARGVNLAGPEFADGAYWPENFYFAYYLSKGMNYLRLPFKWARMQEVLNGALHTENIAEMDRCVEQATSRGMWIALDCHNYMRRGDVGDSPDGIIGVEGSGVTAAHFAEFWGRLADRYKGNPRVVFNLMNEPHGIDHTINIENQNAACASIRATGATNLVLFSPGHYSGTHQFGLGDAAALRASLLLIVDTGNNWALDAHSYLDNGSTGTSPIAVSGAGGAARLGEFTIFCRDNGFRAILGEFNTGPSAASQIELHNHLAYMMANQDVFIGYGAYWLGGQATDTPYWDTNQYMLDPISSTAPVDKPQLAVLRAFTPPVSGAAPGAPYGVLAEAGDGEVTVTYYEGADADWTEYQIGEEDWEELDPSPAIIPDLINGEEATIRLRSVNIDGESAEVVLNATPQAPATWAPIDGMTVQADFEAGEALNLASPEAGFTRTGGLGDTSDGLILQAGAPITMASAFQSLINGQSKGTIYAKLKGVEAAYGGLIIGKLLRIDAPVGGAMAVSFIHQSYSTTKAAAPSGGSGVPFSVGLTWDNSKPAGQRARICVSGGNVAVENGGSYTSFLSSISLVGDWEGSNNIAAQNSIATASYPEPKLLVLAMGPDEEVDNTTLQAKTAALL